MRRKKKTGAGEATINGSGAPAPRSAPNSGSTKTVELQNSVKVSLTVSAGLFAMAAEDRKFVLSLVEKLEEYEATRTGKEG